MGSCGSVSCARQEVGTLLHHPHLLKLCLVHSRYTANICGMNSVFLIGLFSRTGRLFEHTHGAVVPFLSLGRAAVPLRVLLCSQPLLSFTVTFRKTAEAGQRPMSPSGTCRLHVSLYFLGVNGVLWAQGGGTLLAAILGLEQIRLCHLLFAFSIP